MSDVASINLLAVVASLFISLVILYLVLEVGAKTLKSFEAVRLWIDKNQVLRTLLTISGFFITITLVLIQQSSHRLQEVSSKLSEIDKHQRAVLVEMYRANLTIDQTITDQTRDPFIVTWTNFPVEDLRQRYSVLTSYQSDECQNEFASAFSKLETLNKLHEEKRGILYPQDALETKEILLLSSEIIKFASTTQPSIAFVLKSCPSVVKNIRLPNWFKLPEGFSRN
jgi:hypothetical protein